MRLFIAINFEDAFVETLVALQDALQSPGAMGNFTKRENLHMTLAFIGDYGNPEDVVDAMTCARFRPLDIRLEGVQQFRKVSYLNGVPEISDMPEASMRVDSVSLMRSECG